MELLVGQLVVAILHEARAELVPVRCLEEGECVECVRLQCHESIGTRVRMGYHSKGIAPIEGISHGLVYMKAIAPVSHPHGH